ncbi:hypothetical protein J6590_103895, partial [Homalodisca vitripennis]
AHLTCLNTLYRFWGCKIPSRVHFAISENRVLPWTNPGGLLWDNTGCRDVSGDVVVKYCSYNAVLIVFSMSLDTPSLCSRQSVFTNGPVLSSPHTISHTDNK